MSDDPKIIEVEVPPEIEAQIDPVLRELLTAIALAPMTRILTEEEVHTLFEKWVENIKQELVAGESIVPMVILFGKNKFPIPQASKEECPGVQLTIPVDRFTRNEMTKTLLKRWITNVFQSIEGTASLRFFDSWYVQDPFEREPTESVEEWRERGRQRTEALRERLKKEFGSDSYENFPGRKECVVCLCETLVGTRIIHIVYDRDENNKPVILQVKDSKEEPSAQMRGLMTGWVPNKFD